MSYYFLQRMMRIVEEVARDPLASFHFDHDNNSGTYETDLLEKTFVKIANLLRLCFGAAGENIIRSNLQFEPGARSSAIINPMLPGARVYCVFCFCNIRQFEFATECLGQDVLQFVNSIAAIVAENVNYWSNESGSVNKNLGGAFILVFRIGEETELLRRMEDGQLAGVGSAALLRRSSFRDGDEVAFSARQEAECKSPTKLLNSSFTCSKRSINRKKKRFVKKRHQEVDLRRIPGADRVAGRALIACLKILSEVNRHASVQDYRRDRRLNPPGSPPFSVQLGFGLHAGWAIEGAVGSLNKVTATYLSPHMNIAARLASSSPQFATQILFSDAVHELLSPYIQKFCRKLDVVTVKGSEVPLGVFTYDCLLLPSANAGPTDQVVANVRELRPSFVPGHARRVSLEEKPDDPRAYSVTTFKDGGPGRESAWVNNALDPEEVFDRDWDLVSLHRHVTEPFQDTYAQALAAYISGDWVAAGAALETCLSLKEATMGQLLGGATASVVGSQEFAAILLQYLTVHGLQAPSNWSGYRSLSSK